MLAKYVTMTERRKKALRQIGFGVALLAIALISYLYGKPAIKVGSFSECSGAGYPIMESYPRQCRTPDGKTFREDIGNELEKDNLIRIETPRPNAVIKSPLAIKGVARGTWFFLDSHFHGNDRIKVRGTVELHGLSYNGIIHGWGS